MAGHDSGVPLRLSYNLLVPRRDGPEPARLPARLGNAVRTDVHAHDLRERADRADQLATHAPGLIAGQRVASDGALTVVALAARPASTAWP